MQTSYFGKMRTRLIAEAKRAGFNVVDMQPYFVRAYAADHKVASNIPMTGIGTAHGHEVAAAAMREASAELGAAVQAQRRQPP